MAGLSDCRGIPVSIGNRAAIDALEAAHEESLGFHGDPVASIDKVLADHPDFVMGHVFKAAMLTQAMETRIYGTMVAALEAAEALKSKANDRERAHMAAVRAWVEGDFHGAVAFWEEVLFTHPFDLLALQLVHLSDVLLGHISNQRDVVARVFPLWNEGMSGYEWVLGFYSFGLEECRDFSRAEEMGRRAVAMRPKNPYAIHAVAHVLEMQGRQQGGIWWMTSREDDWAHDNFRNHLWWHLSLYHLDLGQIEQVMHIYDTKLCSGDAGIEKYEELDAAALLWRLTLLGVDVGNRWHRLADKWAPSANDTLYAFNDVHAMMAFAADQRSAEIETLLGANDRYVEHANDANTAMLREIGLPFCRALQAFAEERYGDTVDLLLPIRYKTHRLGGSHAQRDVIAWTLVEAALRARRYDLALGLANERTEAKPTSPQNWRMIAQALDGMGDRDGAKRAKARAASLAMG